MKDQDAVEAEAKRLAQELAALLIKHGNQLGVGRGLLSVLVGDVRFCRGELVWALLDVLGSLPEAVGKDHKATFPVDACRDVAAALEGQLVQRKVKS